jgi:hypothetical protein
MPNSLAAQKQRKLLAFTFLFCRPFEKTSYGVEHQEHPVALSLAYYPFNVS